MRAWAPFRSGARRIGRGFSLGTGSNYLDVSEHFKGFYRKRLEFLRKTIPTLQPVVGATGYVLRDKECLEAEAAAIERFLSGSSDIGLDQAIRLAVSKAALSVNLRHNSSLRSAPRPHESTWKGWQQIQKIR